MAYVAKALVSYAEVFVGPGDVRKDWSYKTPDAVATVETAGYFNGARYRLQKGESIKCTMVLAGSVVGRLYVVTAVPASGDVTIAPFSATAIA